MHFAFHHALVVAAVVGSVVLALHRGDRLWPVVAVVASGIDALITFDVMTLSLARYRIDVILPAALIIAAAICWARSSTKPTTTASAVVLLAAAIQLLFAIGVVSG